jgi:hypothetical protein
MNLDNAYSASSVLGESKAKHNGRVDLITEENPHARMQMMEKKMLKNKAVSYCDSLKGLWEDNSLAHAYFSKENIQMVQNAIRAGVYEKSEAKYIIAPPNMDNLMIIMRSYFLSYVQYQSNITDEIKTLNQQVVDYCVHELYSASQAYVRYLIDQSSMYVPLKLPRQTDRDYRQTEFKGWF